MTHSKARTSAQFCVLTFKEIDSSSEFRSESRHAAECTAPTRQEESIHRATISRRCRQDGDVTNRPTTSMTHNAATCGIESGTAVASAALEPLLVRSFFRFALTVRSIARAPRSLQAPMRSRAAQSVSRAHVLRRIGDVGERPSCPRGHNSKWLHAHGTAHERHERLSGGRTPATPARVRAVIFGPELPQVRAHRQVDRASTAFAPGSDAHMACEASEMLVSDLRARVGTVRNGGALTAHRHVRSISSTPMHTHVVVCLRGPRSSVACVSRRRGERWGGPPRR